MTLFQEGFLVDAVQAACAVGIEHLSRWGLDDGAELCARLLPCASGAASKAVRCKPGVPCWFEGQVGKPWCGPVVHDRHAEWACCQCAWFGYPNPAHWVHRCVQVHGGEPLQPLWRGQAVDPVAPGRLCALVGLGHPAHRKALCTPGRREQGLEAASLLGLSTARGVSDASLEREDAPLHLVPGHGRPCRPMTCGMAPDCSTLLADSIVAAPCAPVGVALGFPWALAAGEIPPTSRGRVCVDRLTWVRA